MCARRRLLKSKTLQVCALATWQKDKQSHCTELHERNATQNNQKAHALRTVSTARGCSLRAVQTHLVWELLHPCRSQTRMSYGWLALNSCLKFTPMFGRARVVWQVRRWRSTPCEHCRQQTYRCLLCFDSPLAFSALCPTVPCERLSEAATRCASSSGLCLDCREAQFALSVYKSVKF